jgi:hypothetical protein
VDSENIPIRPEGRFAALAMRIPLEFDAKNSNASGQEQIQVEKHLRVCLAVRLGFTGAVTVSALEPILAEAACKAMKNMKASKELLDALKLSGMDKGDRGEMIAMLLLNLAYDAARYELERRSSPRMPAIPLLSLLRALLYSYDKSKVPELLPTRSLPGECKPLKDAFADAKVYFTHFIRIYDSKVIHRKFLGHFMRRGAAFICAVNQVGFDIGIPFTFRDESLQRRNMGLILVQVKNDHSFTTRPRGKLFHAMDPQELHIFSKKEANPVPVIRMVFALAASGGCVVPVSPPSPTQPSGAAKGNPMNTAAIVDTLAEDSAMDTEESTLPSDHSHDPTPAQNENDKFTAYDIWCGRACAKTFAPIKPGEDELRYDHLLRLSRPEHSAFEIKEDDLSLKDDIVSATRAMLPCASGVGPHWSWGMEPEELEDTDKEEDT